MHPYKGECSANSLPKKLPDPSLHPVSRSACLPCYPGHCSSAQSCLTLCLPWVTSLSAYNDLTASYNCSPTVLCHSIAALPHFQCISITFSYYFFAGSSVQSPVESEFLYITWCFSLYLPFTFALLPSFPHLTWNISVSIASYSPLCSIPWLTEQEISVVCSGCSGGQGLRSGERGVGEIQRSFEGDEIYVHFQALPADGLENDQLLLLGFILCFLPGMEACCPPLLHEETSSMAQLTEKAQVQLPVFNLLSFLICIIPSDENFPIHLSTRCCDCGGDRENRKPLILLACGWLWCWWY